MNRVCDVCRPDGDLEHLTDCQSLLGPVTGSPGGWQPSLLKEALSGFTRLGTVSAACLETGQSLFWVDVHAPS